MDLEVEISARQSDYTSFVTSLQIADKKR